MINSYPVEELVQRESHLQFLQCILDEDSKQNGQQEHQKKSNEAKASVKAKKPVEAPKNCMRIDQYFKKI